MRNPYYWQPGKPYLNSVTWTDVADDNTRAAAAQGRPGAGGRVPRLVHGQHAEGTPGVTMDLFPSTRTDYLAFNELRKPFKDVHVRRAISLAINREALVQAVLFGNGKPANSLFPPQVPYYQKATPGLQYNLAAAKKEMADSSVPHGFSTTMLILSGEQRPADHRPDRAVGAQAARHQR